MYKGIPLNKDNLKRLKTQLLIRRLRSSSQGSLSMSEDKFDLVCSELSDSALLKKDKDIKALLELRDRIKKASLESYPGIISKDEKYEHILETFSKMQWYGITGRCFHKLQELVKPIKWVDELLEAYKSAKVVHQDLSRESFISDFKVKQMEKKAKDEILEIFSLLNPQKSDWTIERKNFKVFPELRSILNCISLEHSSKLMSKFKNDKTINISVMLRLQHHREVLNTERDEDKLFNTKREKVLEFMKKVKALSERQDVGIYEFTSLVEDYVTKFKHFSDYPKYPTSLFYQAFKWLGQAKLLVNMIKEIKKFDAQKLNRDSYNNYKRIYEAICDQSFKKVNIRKDELYGETIQDFIDFMKEADSVLERFCNIDLRISNAQFSIKKAKEGDLSVVLIDALTELPSFDNGKDWMQKAITYTFVKPEMSQIK